MLEKSAPAFRRNALSWDHQYLGGLEASGKRLTFWNPLNPNEVVHYETGPQIIRQFCVHDGQQQVLLVLTLPSGQVFKSSQPNVMLYTFGQDEPVSWFEPEVTVVAGAFSDHAVQRIHLVGHRPKGNNHRELVHYSGSSLSDLSLSVIDTIPNDQVPGVIHLCANAQQGDATTCGVVFYGESLQGSMLYQYRDGFWIHDQTLRNERVLGLAPFAGGIVGLLETLDEQEGFLLRDMVISHDLHHSAHGLPSCLSARGSLLAVAVDAEIKWFRGEV